MAGIRGSDLMKATLADRPPAEPGWLFERKLDGIRCLAVAEDGGVRLLSRNDLALDGRFPEIAAALAAQPAGDFAIDGEVVALEGDRDSFARLARSGREAATLAFYAFDALVLGGEDVRALPLVERKARLRAALRFDERIRFSEHAEGGGDERFEEACRRGWEGLIAKRADSPYAARRSRDWLKVKCGREQEFVIGGYTEPRGSRTGFGALLLGHYDGGRLVYAGKVGTGFDRALLAELTAQMEALRRDTSPFDAGDPPRRATWIEPELVGQVAFSEWTADGRLRHPRFLGLREDKAAREVVREAPD
ncbi:MAG TPA: non-homologous end-joining DNA ligase [Solirubrobacteraceae bacterium]|nr:non-homologous end-joining DNA ligase [Solirubrobacteraceae bacterium]